ncbi:MAG TPA: hypothetical protein VFC78_04680 [Tepidisphaeraceae bacterium]|nr:hypothetical protein [Tepidisphaeraceae bacterium]
MVSRIEQDISPLEQFVRDYVEARNGVWDEVEPQVYDLLIGPEMTQVAFDPEALPEHPQAQLASAGSPLLDRLLADAAQRWSAARFHRIGLNLHPQNIEQRLGRALSLPQGASASIRRARAMSFPQAIFWFKATFVGDQKEEEILPIGIDLHYAREVRHLDLLLAPNCLSEDPQIPLPQAPHVSLAAGYRVARGQVAPTVSSLANARRRDWTVRVEKQLARMSAYYAQLRAEANEQADRTADKTRAASRREAIDREEQMRVAELRQKSAVRTLVNLAAMMIVHQPKLLLGASITDKGRSLGDVSVVWDTMLEAFEALACPACRQPTFALRLYRPGLGCPNCAGAQTSKLPAPVRGRRGD